ncbi:hypothetical protein FRB96_001743 [Tulasnella sp. 330]|nr:hypothetical protein FRB96_001743 [Tulasnella sp. 330]
MVALSTLFVNALSQVASFNSPFAHPPTTTLALPEGWSYQNCYQHSESRHALSVKVYSGSENSLSSCAAKCDNAGFAFAGAVSGQECWCGNALANAELDTCAEPCSGDSSEICGDSNRISVLSKWSTSSPATTVTPSKRAKRTTLAQRHHASMHKKRVTGYQSYGCYVDSTSRVLPIASTSSTSMTTSNCQSFCASQSPSLPYFGTENGNECWCGNALPSSSFAANPGDCSTPCTGNAGTTCGGGWRLNVFGPTVQWTNLGCYVDQAARTLNGLSFSSNAMTPALCQQSCSGFAYAGTEDQDQCFCGNSLTVSTTSTGCTQSCSGDSTQLCGGGWAMNIYQSLNPPTTTTTTTTTPSSTVTKTLGWATLGCYGDQASRTLAGSSYTDSAMTPALCQQKCSGYTYAGTEYQTECYCGNSMTASVTSTACTLTCGGDSSQICGGSWAISIYRSSSSATTTTSSSPTPTSATSLGCYADQAARTLSGASFTDPAMTPSLCQTKCAGFAYFGVEYSTECYCAASMSSTQTSTGCSYACGGDSTKICGGSWAINVYQMTGTTTTTTTTTSSAPTSTGSQSMSGSWWTANGPNTGKVVIAHYMVGNTYGRTYADWTNDIQLAAAQNIDAFALNMGIDSWQPARMQDAYNAASALSSQGINFKMFVSFDMSSFNCGSTGAIISTLQQFANHPAQLKTPAGEMWVSSFDGGSCSMWQSTLNSVGVSYRFVPAFFNDLSGATLKSQQPSIGGDFLWNGGWPSGGTPILWDNDNYRIQNDGLNRAAGDIYMTSVSPWFFVHLNSGRNFIYDFDNWLYVERWEMMHDQRSLVDAVEIISWNDWGESHYISPVDPLTEDIPSGAYYATPQFDHTGFLYMTGYYASYYKTGNRPTVTADKIFMWGRTQPAGLYLGSDPIGPVQNAGWVGDTLFVVLFATSSGTLTVTQGGTSWSAAVVAGPNKLSNPLVPTSSVTAVLTRNGQTVFTFSAPLVYAQGGSSEYNFNGISASGP